MVSEMAADDELPLTFDGFVATRIEAPNVAETLDDDSLAPRRGWVYYGRCFIETMPTGEPFLSIGSMQYSGSLEELEGILYQDWFVPEFIRPRVRGH